MTEQLLPFRIRPDLVIVPTGSSRRARWTIKDPLSLQYFGLNEHEYAVLAMLDGSTSFATLSERFSRNFPGITLTPDRFAAFVARLADNGLLIGSRAGLGKHLADRDLGQRRHSLVMSLLNPFSFRVGGWDPSGLLSRLESVTQLLVSPLVFGLVALLIALAAGMVVLRFDEVLSRLPTFGSLVTPANLVLLAMIWLCTKVLHELAHASACRHFGGECHDVGILFLVFLPLFYCDVSDAWMLSNRWQRIAISFAGIAMELILAALLTVLWWFSLPGFANSLFLNGMLVCSLGTVLFNGNPLLRYDGYHVLADLIDIPNLGERSRSTVWSVFDRVVLGRTRNAVATENLLVLFIYGVASAIYRLFVLGLIAWFLLTVTVELEVASIGRLLVGVLWMGALLPLSVAVAQRTRSVLRDTKVARRRAIIGMLLFSAALVGILAIPLPYSVRAPFVTGAGDADFVFATVSGRIESAVEPGRLIRKGDPLMVLSDPDRHRTSAAYSTQVARLRSRIQTLEAARTHNIAAARELPTIEDQLQAAIALQQQTERDREELIIRSPRDGVVMPVRRVIGETAETTGGLPRWSGSATHPVNRGATVEAATLVCLVGDNSVVEAFLYVDEEQIDSVEPGQTVRLQLASQLGAVCSGEVTDIARLPTQAFPRELLAAGTVPDANSVRYQVTVRIRGNARVTLYSPGQAKIRCRRRPAIARIYDAIRQTFGFSLR